MKTDYQREDNRGDDAPESSLSSVTRRLVANLADGCKRVTDQKFTTKSDPAKVGDTSVTGRSETESGERKRKPRKQVLPSARGNLSARAEPDAVSAPHRPKEASVDYPLMAPVERSSPAVEAVLAEVAELGTNFPTNYRAAVACLCDYARRVGTVEHAAMLRNCVREFRQFPPLPPPDSPEVAAARIRAEFHDLPPAWCDCAERDIAAANGDPRRLQAALGDLLERARGWRLLPRGQGVR